MLIISVAWHNIFAYYIEPHIVAFLANRINVASTNIDYSYDLNVGIDIVVNIVGDLVYTNPS